MQTSVADSTSAVANPTFNNLLHKTEIHLTTEREYSKGLGSECKARET